MFIEDDEVPVDITYPARLLRSEVSCIVCTCPQTYFINIMGANYRNDVHMPVMIKQSCLVNGN